MGPFAARVAADKLILGAFVLVLFAAWCAMRSLGDRRARVSFLVVGSAFVGALVARPLGLLFLVLGVALVLHALIRPPRAWTSGSFALAGLVLLSLSRAFPPSPAPQAVDADPAAETIAALERGNLFQARLWGERWVAEYPDRAGDAALVLAEIDWRLGHHERARAIAADVASRGPDVHTQRRATARLLEWKDVP
jgi:hypothetical protein